MRRYSDQLREKGHPPLLIRIGINTGEVIVGNIGSEKRTKYGAVGSEINTAYRIESYTVGGQILLSATTFERVKSVAVVRNTLEVEFKGLDRPVTLYDVSGLGGAYAAALPEGAPVTFTPLEPPLLVACRLVEGKTVSDSAIAGYITGLAPTAAEAALESEVPTHANLKLAWAAEEAAGVSEVYAKVLECRASPEAGPGARVRLEFTTLPDDARAFLEGRRVGQG